MFVGQTKGSVHNRMVVRSQKDNVHRSALPSISCCLNEEQLATIIISYSPGEAENRLL